MCTFKVPQELRILLLFGCVLNHDQQPTSTAAESLYQAQQCQQKKGEEPPHFRIVDVCASKSVAPSSRSFGDVSGFDAKTALLPFAFPVLKPILANQSTTKFTRSASASSTFAIRSRLPNPSLSRLHVSTAWPDPQLLFRTLTRPSNIYNKNDVLTPLLLPPNPLYPLGVARETSNLLLYNHWVHRTTFDAYSAAH